MITICANNETIYRQVAPPGPANQADYYYDCEDVASCWFYAAHEVINAGACEYYVESRFKAYHGGILQGKGLIYNDEKDADKDALVPKALHEAQQAVDEYCQKVGSE